MNFHIGDKVVYPNHGVGVIEQISSRSIGTTIERFYLLHIKASSLKVMVPCQNAGSVGLRRVVRNGEIQKVLDALSVNENGSNGDWKDRFKENSDRMRTGSLLGSRRRPEKPDRLAPGQASFVPGKEDARARPLPARQRTRHGSQL